LVPSDQFFFWPAQKGQRIPLHNIDTGNRNIRLVLEALSTTPKAFIIRNFLSHDEADELIRLAVPKLTASTITDAVQKQVTTDYRNSQTASLNFEDSPLLEQIDRRAHQVTRIFPARGITEPIQIVHYGPGQHFHAHHDFVVFDQYQSIPRDNNRYITLLLYLNDVQEGGYTSFPMAQGFNDSYSAVEHVPPGDCRGLRVKPEKGAALLFYNTNPAGSLDQYSYHLGCDIIKGEKWVANKWIWRPTTLK